MPWHSSVVTTASLQVSCNSCSTAPGRRARKVRTRATGRGARHAAQRQPRLFGTWRHASVARLRPCTCRQKESPQPVDEESIA